MAKAPTPGVGKRKEAAQEAAQILTITIAGETHTLALNNLPMRERIAVRKQVGLPLEQFIADVTSGASTIGLDTLAVLWWLARRANGESGLTWAQAETEWPDDLDPDELSFDQDDADPNADDPEA